MSFRRALLFALLAGWCLFALWVSVTFAVAITEGLYPGPFKDMWWMMPFVERVFAGQASWVDWLAVHGGAHRLLVPRFLFVLDYGLFAGSNVFLIAVSLSMQAVAWGLWFWHVRAMPWPRTWKLFAWGLAWLLAFSGMQIENVLYTFDSQWFLANTFSLLALCALARAWGASLAARSLLWALCFGLLASFSSFLGLCALLLIALCVVAGGRGRAGIWFVLLVGLFTAWYVSGLDSGAYAALPAVDNRSDVAAAMHFVFNLARWLLIYIGSPLTRDQQWLGMTCAVPAILYALGEAWLLLRTLRTGATWPRHGFFVLAACYALAVALATGLGRLYFINTADEDRYQTINLVFWLALCCLLVGRLQVWRPTAQGTGCVLVVVWALYVGGVWHGRDTVARLQEFERVQASAIAQRAGILDFAAIRETLILGDKSKGINRALMHDAFLQRQGWGTHAPALRAPVPLGASPVGLPSCVVQARSAQALSPGHWSLRVSLDGVSKGDILFLDAQGRWIGSAIRASWQQAQWLDALTLAPPPPEWLGYANTRVSDQAWLQALLVQKGTAVCAMQWWLQGSGP